MNAAQNATNAPAAAKPGTSPAPTKGATRWIVILILFLVRVAMGFQFQAIASVSKNLQDQFTFNHATIGLLVGLYLLPGIFLAIPGGWIGGRIGDKRTIVIGLTLMSLGGMIGGLADSGSLVFFGRAVSGAGVVLLFLIIPKTVGEWFTGRQLFLAMSIFLNGWPVGMGIALICQPMMAAAWGWESVFIATSVGTAAACLMCLLCLPLPPKAIGANTSALSHKPGLLGGLGSRQIILVMLAALLWTSVNSAQTIVQAFGPRFIETLGQTATAASALTSINLWVGIVTVPVGGILAARYGRPTLFMILASFMGGGAILLIWLIPDHFVLWFVIMGAFFFLAAGVTVALPLEVLPPEHRAMGLGVFYTVWYAGMAGFPPAAGWTRDLTGAAGAPILFAGILGLSGLFALLAFRMVQRASGATPPA